MSQAHKNELLRIKNEYEEVAKLLSSLAQTKQKPSSLRKGQFSTLPHFDRNFLESAKATADDAYALILIAKSEGFMRDYLRSLNILLGSEPKLSVLIDKCRKEFNKTEPKIRIQRENAQAMHDLREQRNSYAHGYGSNIFPPIGKIVYVLGNFFDQLP